MIPLRLIFDCDPGLDDAVALALAMASPELEVTALATVACNAPIETVTGNAEAVMDRLRCRFPLYPGASRPLVLDPRHSTDLWGGDGKLPLAKPGKPVRRIDTESYEALVAEADVVCAIGSLTNIARLIERGLKPRKLAIMGGALGRGNATPSAELNIWADPQAAAIVFSSAIPITLVPLDVTRTLNVPKDAVARLRGASTRSAKLCAELLPHAGSNAHPSAIHDAAVIGHLLWPDLFTAERGRISVVTEGAEEGRTIFAAAPNGPHTVLTRVVRDELFRHMLARLEA